MDHENVSLWHGSQKGNLVAANTISTLIVKEVAIMADNQSVSQAIGGLFRAIRNRVVNKKWWKTLLWICWFILAVAAISSVFGSLQEYESRPALTCGVVFVILLLIGAICWRRGRSATSA